MSVRNPARHIQGSAISGIGVRRSPAADPPPFQHLRAGHQLTRLQIDPRVKDRVDTTKPTHVEPRSECRIKNRVIPSGNSLVPS